MFDYTVTKQDLPRPRHCVCVARNHKAFLQAIAGQSVQCFESAFNSHVLVSENDTLFLARFCVPGYRCFRRAIDQLGRVVRFLKPYISFDCHLRMCELQMESID